MILRLYAKYLTSSANLLHFSFSINFFSRFSHLLIFFMNHMKKIFSRRLKRHKTRSFDLLLNLNHLALCRLIDWNRQANLRSHFDGWKCLNINQKLYWQFLHLIDCSSTRICLILSLVYLINSNFRANFHFKLDVFHFYL